MLALFLALLAPDPSAKKLPPPKAVDLSGYYSCIGVQGGKEYRAIVMLDKFKDKNAYVISWSLGGANFVGIGFIKDDKFLCGWSGATMRGIGIYSFQGKSMIGEILAIPGDGVPYRERWTFLRKLDEKVDEAEAKQEV